MALSETEGLMSDTMVIDVDSDWRFVLTTRKILHTAQ
jgi:hypothetical protein